MRMGILVALDIVNIVDAIVSSFWQLKQPILFPRKAVMLQNIYLGKGEG